MSTDAVMQFFIHVNQEKSIQSGLQRSLAKGLIGIVDVANAHGYQFTLPELQTVIGGNQSPVSSPDEITDVELDSIAGGVGGDNTIEQQDAQTVATFMKLVGLDSYQSS